MVARTPSTASAFADDDKAQAKAVTHPAPEGTLPSYRQILAFAVVSVLFWHVVSANPRVTLHAPALPVWLEVGAAFALGGAINSVVAVLFWNGFSTLALSWSLASLCVPYLLPLAHGISGSAVALINFIGCWKALDIAAGTHPTAVLDNGLGGLVAHFASPVEYRIERREQHAKALTARPGLWQTELLQTARDYAGLALAGLVRTCAAMTPNQGKLSAAIELYAEVWTIYLFLRLFTGAFSTLLALGGYHGNKMWDSPLTRSTSISDFWSRRWNLLIHGLFRRTVFVPLTKARGVPPSVAGLLAFALSGAFHEYAFALAQPSLRASLGRCLLFFLAQAPVVTLEKALRNKFGVPTPFAQSSTLCTIFWTLVLVPPAPLFLHPLKTSGVFDQIYLLVPRLAYNQ